MKKHFGVVLGAKIINVVSAALMALAGGLLLFLPDLGAMAAQRILLGVLFALTGGAKIFGYFSNDLYRLAFQFDFAIGIFCELLALLLMFTPTRAFSTLPTLLAVYVVLDALLKLQITFDARRFGMHSWLLILITALVLCAVGAFAIVAVLQELMRPAAAVGLALAVDGLENTWITAYTVRVRARKKRFSEQFGLEEDE